MDDAEEDSTAFELCCIDENIASDNTGEYFDVSTAEANIPPASLIVPGWKSYRPQDQSCILL